jgi:hypothetical protein
MPGDGVSRDLARAYGYLGDVQKSLGEPDDEREAIESYRTSLQLRERIDGEEKSDESSFQRARGLANFGSIVRDLGDDLDIADFAQPQSTNQPLEIYVLQEYVEPALELQRTLMKRVADNRFTIDFAWTSNIGAELYFFAALRPGVTPEVKRAHLEQASRLVDSAIAALSASGSKEIGKLLSNERNILATSYMLKLQIDRQGGVESESASQWAKEIKDLTDVAAVGYKALANEQLLNYCVLLAALKDWDTLGSALELLSDRGAMECLRAIRHLESFEDKEVGQMLIGFAEQEGN